ncbi:MAG: hypothetical protein ACRDTN_06005 [Mycobacterium sp.]
MIDATGRAAINPHSITDEIRQLVPSGDLTRTTRRCHRQAHNMGRELWQQEHAMESNPVAGREHKAAGAEPAPSTQAARMRAAVGQAIAIGPSFLHGDVDADQMANTMVRAVRDYVEQERAAGGDGRPRDAEARALQGILSELLGCGSGYLAGHCDAACVARTMTQMVREFGRH